MLKYYFEVMILLEYYLIAYSHEKNSKSCIMHLANKYIDYNILNDPDGYEVISENKTYILNICGPALRCENLNVSACIINEKNEIEAIGLLKNLKIDKTKLKYKYNGKLRTLIEFKCNRHVKASLEHKFSTSKEFEEFTLYTFLVCKKMPLKCKSYDVENNLEYDITSLYKHESNWAVKNVSEDIKIYLNLCGSIHAISGAKNTECDYEDTQICLIDQYDNSINLGVFSSALQPTEDGLSVEFTGGSLCGHIRSIVTKIDFICSFNDSGPTLKNSSDCEYHISWHTPSACPYYMSINKDCIIQNEKLYSSNDKEYQISPSSKLKYNICGTLANSCNKKMDVSVCLIYDDREIILGLTNKTIISKDADVYMNLTGELCDNGNLYSSVNIEFYCDYTENKSENILVDKPKCSATITVFTERVCRQLELLDDNCIISVNNSHSYDLSPLILKNRNYEVTDPDNANLIYLLNVCEPIVFSKNSMCPVGSSICLKNNAEPNIHRKFKSLGYFTTSSGLKIRNNLLTTEYEGEVCSDASSKWAEYKIFIEYHCERDTHKLGIKLFKSSCRYTFVWRTQHACLRERIGESTSLENETRIIEQVSSTVEGENRSNAIPRTDITTIINMNASEDMYTIPFHDIPVEQKQIISNKEVHSNDISSTMISSTVTSSTEVNVLQNEESKLEHTTNEISAGNIIMIHIPFQSTNTRGIFIENCILKDHSNQFDMRSLPKITHIWSKTGNQYTINICSYNTHVMCNTKTCVNHLANITVEKESLVLNFTEKISLNKRRYNFVILLKCSDEFKQPLEIQEDEYNVQLEWKNGAACAFLKPKSESHHTAAKIVGSSVAVMIIITVLCIAAYYYIIRKRRNQESTTQLVECQYSRMKDETKIV